MSVLSECKNQRRGYAYVEVKGGGGGIATSLWGDVFASTGSVGFEDSLSEVDPDVFNGDFKMVAVGTPIWSPFARMQLGGAYGSAAGVGLSTSFDLTGARGKAKVLRKRTECCTE
jgi:hypothetical protein